MIPIFRSLISIPAGIERMPVAKFLLLTSAGSLIWNAIFVLAGFYLGENWHIVEQYAGIFQKIVIVVVVLAVLYWVTTQDPQDPEPPELALPGGRTRSLLDSRYRSATRPAAQQRAWCTLPLCSAAFACRRCAQRSFNRLSTAAVRPRLLHRLSAARLRCAQPASAATGCSSCKAPSPRPTGRPPAFPIPSARLILSARVRYARNSPILTSTFEVVWLVTSVTNPSTE